MNLVLVGRNSEKLAAAERLAREEARSAGSMIDCLICSGDLTDTGFEEELIRSGAEHFGGIDVLINCAGVAQHDAFEDVTPEQFDRIMASNVRAPYFLCQKVLPWLRRSEMATIINISRIGSMDYANAGAAYEMDAIAAVIVGGTRMAGGRGSIIGTMLGVLIIGVMNNLLNLVGVNPFLCEAFKGFIVVVAVLIQKKEATS